MASQNGMVILCSCEIVSSLVLFILLMSWKFYSNIDNVDRNRVLAVTWAKKRGEMKNNRE